MTGDGVTLIRADGSTSEFFYDDSGALVSPFGGRHPVWADPTSGEISVVADGGMAYRFDRDGLLQSVVSPADDRSPAATQFTWTGANPRLTKMKDPVSNRSVDLSYWGGPGCPTLPAGMVSAPGQLCEVELWDGRVTELFYNASAQLVQVVNPGGVQTDYTYDASNQLTSVKSPTLQRHRSSRCPCR